MVLVENEAKSGSLENNQFLRTVASVFEFEAHKLLLSCLSFPTFETETLEKKLPIKNCVMLFKVQ